MPAIEFQFQQVLRGGPQFNELHARHGGRKGIGPQGRGVQHDSSQLLEASGVLRRLVTSVSDERQVAAHRLIYLFVGCDVDHEVRDQRRPVQPRIEWAWIHGFRRRRENHAEWRGILFS